MRNDILKLVRKNEDEIKKYGVKRIGIFGSFVKLRSRKTSDIDVLVEFKPGEKTFDHYMDLKFFLQKLLKREVDLVVKDALKAKIKPYITKEVIYA